MTATDAQIDPYQGVEPKKAQIMATTEQLIAERGFDATRLRDVANRAGVSIGKIQHYFESRDILMHETLSMASWAREREWAELATGVSDPIERIRVLLSGSVTEQHRCKIWLETCAASTRYPDLVPMVKGIYVAWRKSFMEALETGVANGSFHPVKPLDEILDMIMLVIDGLMVAVAVDVFDFPTEYSGTFLQDEAGRLLQYDFGPPPVVA